MPNDKIIINENLKIEARLNGLTIREAQPSDFKQIYLIALMAFKGVVDDCLSEPKDGYYYVVATHRDPNSDEESIVGVSAYQINVDKNKEKFIKISDIAIDPKHQKKGIGSFLLATSLYHGKCLGCKNSELLSSPEGRKLYVKFGYQSDPSAHSSMSKDDVKNFIHYPLIFFNDTENKKHSRKLTSATEDIPSLEKNQSTKKTYSK